MSLVPISDEQAKAAGAYAELGKTAIETARDGVGYVAQVLNTLPEDLVGWVIGDRLRVARWEQAQRLQHDAEARLRARGVKDRESISPSLAAPLLDAATSETDPTLADLWARLLANALDPARKGRVRRRFIDAVKSMDPLDARVFQAVIGQSGSLQPTVAQFLGSHLEVSPDDADVSLHNLSDLGLIAGPQFVSTSGGPEMEYRDTVRLVAFGRQFARAVDP